MGIWVVLFPKISFAAPSITGISGTIHETQTVMITGSGFGTKSPAKPYLWVPFDGSANPSSLGILQSWTLDSMAYSSNEGFNGSGGLKATNSSGVWTAHANAQGFAWNDWNQKVYLYRRIKQNFVVVNNTETNPPGDLNWKVLRIWSENFTYPNFYMAIGGSTSMTTEGVNGGNAYMDHLGKMDVARGTPNTWRLEEVEYRSNSDPDLSDGEFRYWVGSDLVAYLPHFTYTNRYFKLRDGTASGSSPMVMFFAVHGVKANVTFPSYYRYWADDVYLDTSWARVMIGNASTLATSTYREIQIPTTWSNNSITVSSHFGQFGSGQTAYLYVIDSNGAVNSNGYPITIGGGVPASSPCNTVTTSNFSQAAYISYGAPFDAFQTSTNLMSTQCNSADTHTINLITGVTGDTTRIVYTKGYWYDAVTTSWRQYTGTCTGALNGEWCQGSVSVTITDANVSTASSTNPTYLVGMTCSVQGGSWKCGCRDTSCTNFSWQIQGAGM